VPEAEFCKVLRPEISCIVGLLGHHNEHTQRSVGDLLDKLTEYGEYHPNTSYALLICLKLSFARYYFLKSNRSVQYLHTIEWSQMESFGSGILSIQSEWTYTVKLSSQELRDDVTVNGSRQPGCQR
jgi:hypothetical protein